MQTIAILTLHWVPNYGANLQNFALSEYLKTLGKEPVVLNYRASGSQEYHSKMVVERQMKIHEEHINEFINQTQILKNNEDILNFLESKSIKKVIVGSDALFRVKLGTREDMLPGNPFWGGWNRSKKFSVLGLSISSMGANLLGLNKNLKSVLSNDIRNFNELYVRDLWTKLQILFLTRKNPSLLSDPALLLPYVTRDIERYIRPEILKFSQGNYIVSCFTKENRDQAVIDKIDEHAASLGYENLSLSHPEGFLVRPDNKFFDDVSPLEWMFLIKNCKGIVAERFHPIVIAAAFKRPFLSVDNYQSNNSWFRKRIDSFKSKTRFFVNSIGEGKRLITDANEIISDSTTLELCVKPLNESTMKKIDWETTRLRSVLSDWVGNEI